MSTVVGNLLNRLFPPTPIPTTIILGLDSSGKTTFLYFLKLRQIVQTIPSIGVNVETVQVPTSSTNGNAFKMTAWDIGTGCASPKNFSLTRMYLTFAEAIIWLVDSSDRERLNESVGLLREIIPYGNENAPILILASKSDKSNSLSTDELRVAFSQATTGRLSSVFKTAFTQETCTNFGSSGMHEAFDWLNISLDIAKSLKKGGPAIPENPNLQTNLRAPNVLAQKLESWLSRTENDTSPEEFLKNFESYNLPDWDHYTHIRFAYLILVKHGRQKGKDIIFKSLEDYIANSQQTKGRTFHVTMTYFWIQIVHLGIRNTPPSDSTKPSLNDFARFLLVNPHVVDGSLWSDFYSKDVLMSSDAKTAMVLPDKKPLPNLIARDAITSFGVPQIV